MKPEDYPIPGAGN